VAYCAASKEAAFLFHKISETFDNYIPSRSHFQCGSFCGCVDGQVKKSKERQNSNIPENNI
jgi:hypothetical protein